MTFLSYFNQLDRSDPDYVKQLIISNIANILSSKRPLWTQQPSSDNLKNSIASFGVCSLNKHLGEYQTGLLAHQVKQLIDYFEPRLKDASVEILENRSDENKIAFRIEGYIKTCRGIEALSLDSTIDLSNANLKLQEESFA